MSWIVLGENKRLIELRSKPSDNELEGLLSVGSFLTVTNKKTSSKIILRVEDSIQIEPYAPTPLTVEMDLEGLVHDEKCYNKIIASRLKDLSTRDDGKFDFIYPRSIAERSTVDEIREAIGSYTNGPFIFPATVYNNQSNLIKSAEGNFMNVGLNNYMFWHQTVLCGETGSGKTVAIKYLANHFVKNLDGCVIALNVKEDDLLHMEKPTTETNDTILKEWDSINMTALGIDNFEIYQPSGSASPSSSVDGSRVHKITLKIMDLDPESLLGLIREQMSPIATRWFPEIFRSWQDSVKSKSDVKFIDFVNYFDEIFNDNRLFPTLDINGTVSAQEMPGQTCGNISRAISLAVKFFDTDAKPVDVTDFLQKGKFSTIDLSGDDAIEFGSIFLRHILKVINKEKSSGKYENTPVLVIVDEAHKFHSKDQGTSEALKYLEQIARTGRSREMGIIFASQDLATIPTGLTNIVGTLISFRTQDKTTAGKLNVKGEDLKSLGDGYAVAQIHKMPHLKWVKFPMTPSGVQRKRRESIEK